MKSARIWSFSGLYFPVFGLNTERPAAFLRIQSEYGKSTDQKDSEYGHFSRSAINAVWKLFEKSQPYFAQ